MRRYTTALVKCNKIYSNYKCEYQPLWKRAGGNLRRAFINRQNEWKFFSSHYASEEFKALSENMKTLRQSENKLDHTSGPTLFGDRALKHKDSKAPHTEAYMALHERNALHVVAKLKNALETHLVGERANQAPLLYGATQTEESTICLPKARDVVFEEVLGPSKGSMVHGMGGVQVRDSVKSGSAKGCLGGLQKKKLTRLSNNCKEIEVMRLSNNYKFDNLMSFFFYNPP